MAEEQIKQKLKAYKELPKWKGKIFMKDEETCYVDGYIAGANEGAETTLRKVIKYFSSRIIDDTCGGYFSRLLENEEGLQELAKELENV